MLLLFRSHGSNSVKMRHVFFPQPTPKLLPPDVDPVAAVETASVPGQSVLVLLWDEGFAPHDRLGWVELHGKGECRLWRYSKD